MICQYIIKMNYNDNQQNPQHLLNWVNQERFYIDEHFKIYSLEQIKESKLLPLLLDKIHSSFFASLIDKPYDHFCYLVEIEKYLLEMEDLKLKRSYKQVLIDRNCISDIVKLVLFMIMRNEIKQEFVDRILDLQEDTQIYLMEQLKFIQSQTENSMQIKEIVFKVEELEDQNELLRQKIKEIEQKNEEIKFVKSLMRQQNEKLYEANRLNLLQKAEIMELLGVNQMKDYFSIFKDLETERIALIHSQKESQANNGKLAEQNQEMEEKVLEDKLIIEHLNEEINHYKAIVQECKAESKKSQITLFKENKQNVKGDRLATSLIPARMTKSIEPDGCQDTTISSFKHIRTIEDEDQPLGNSIREHNENLNEKLQKMYISIQSLNSEIAQLKEEKSRLMAKNKKKEKIISMAYRQFMNFQFEYQFTISG